MNLIRGVRWAARTGAVGSIFVVLYSLWKRTKGVVLWARMGGR